MLKLSLSEYYIQIQIQTFSLSFIIQHLHYHKKYHGIFMLISIL